MGEQATRFELRFEGQSVAEANELALELQSEIRAAHEEAAATIAKDDPSTQDFGATLVVVLGTPAVAVIAKAIADYIQRRGVSVVITPEGGAEIKNVRSADLASIVKNLPRKK